MTSNIENNSVYRVTLDVGGSAASAGATPAQSRESAPETERSKDVALETASREIEESIENFNAQLAKQRLTANYVINPENQSVTIYLINPETGDIVRTIPPMSLASATSRLSRGMGALVDGYL